MVKKEKPEDELVTIDPVGEYRVGGAATSK